MYRRTTDGTFVMEGEVTSESLAARILRFPSKFIFPFVPDGGVVKAWSYWATLALFWMLTGWLLVRLLKTFKR